MEGGFISHLRKGVFSWHDHDFTVVLADAEKHIDRVCYKCKSSIGYLLTHS